MHLQPVFQNCPMRGGAVADSLFADGLCLPSGSSLTSEDQDRIVDIVMSTGSDRRTGKATAHA